MQMIYRTLFIVAALWASSTLANAEPIGSALRVVRDVKGEINKNPRPLASGDEVVQDEIIAAASDSQAELQLKDNSKVAVGPGSRLILDKFVYDPGANNNSISFNLVRGAFRFITGVAHKKDYLLTTPTAAISVRGTVFDVYVAADGTTYILLQEGSITACDRGGRCARLANPCSVVRIAANDSAPNALHGFNRLPATQRPDFATAFPFVVTPPGIDPEPRFTRTAVESGTCKPEINISPRQQRAEIQTPTPRLPRYASEPRKEAVAGESTASLYEAKPWSGGYAGIIAGAIWQQSDPYLNCLDFTVTGLACSSTQVGIPGNAYRTKRTGFTGGGEIGYNFQLGNLVFGGAADLAYTDIQATSRYDQVFVFPCCTIVRGSTLHQELNGLSTVRGRVGYAFGNVLVYGTGGLAVGQVEYSYQVSFPDIAGTASDGKSKLAVGYTGGGGVEFRVGDWSFKTEYLFYDLGQESLNAPFYLAGVQQPFTFKPRFETEGHIVRVGTSYHFD
jgi:opacity protein-like surface antigen